MDEGQRGTAERYQHGGIFGLLELLDEYGEAIEADLLSQGYHRADIGTPRLDWREFRVIVKWLGPGTALYRAKFPKSWTWTPDTELLAACLFALQGANWQRAGGRGDKPKLIRRPAEKTDPTETFDTSVGTDDRKKAMDDELARRRAQRDARRRGQRRKPKMIPRSSTG